MIKLSDKNIGKSLIINGNKETISKILANKEKFRVERGEGETIHDYGIDDIDEARDLIVNVV